MVARLIAFALLFTACSVEEPTHVLGTVGPIGPNTVVTDNEVDGATSSWMQSVTFVTGQSQSGQAGFSVRHPTYGSTVANGTTAQTIAIPVGVACSFDSSILSRVIVSSETSIVADIFHERVSGTVKNASGTAAIVPVVTPFNPVDSDTSQTAATFAVSVSGGDLVLTFTGAAGSGTNVNTILTDLVCN